MKKPRAAPALIGRKWKRALFVAALLVPSLVPTVDLNAQQLPAAGPDAALSEALAAACRQDAAGFSNSLTVENAKAYRALPELQRTAIMKRFVLLDDPGRALLSTGASGHMVVRCETPGIATEMRFGETRVRENLAFVPLEIPLPELPSRSITFGMVREGGNWKLLSVGLILLDIPAMAKQWQQGDLDAQERGAIADLREIALALQNYRKSFGKLPDALAQLGPAPANGVSPDAAGLLSGELASGTKDGYTIHYTVVPAPANHAGENSNERADFNLASAPTDYGKTGGRSFFLDSSGVVRGADKQGAAATSTDPSTDNPSIDNH